MLPLVGENETARVHQPCRWRGGRPCLRTRSADFFASCRATWSHNRAGIRGSACSISTGPERSRLGRGPGCNHRVSLGGRSIRPAAGIGRRSCPPSRGCDRHNGRKCSLIGGKGGDNDNSRRLSRHPRSKPGSSPASIDPGAISPGWLRSMWTPVGNVWR